jgi:hypothetical protein
MENVKNSPITVGVQEEPMNASLNFIFCTFCNQIHELLIASHQ